MKRKLIIAGIIGLIVAGYFALRPTSQPKSTKPVVKIGISLPLTGTYAGLGNMHRVAMQMAVEEVEKEGAKYDYELIFEDDAMDKKRVQANLQKFINLDKVNIYTDIDSGSSHVANATLGNKDILQFSWTTDRDVPKNRDLTFTFSGLNEKKVDLFISELKKKKITNINVFSQSTAYIESIVKVLEPKLTSANITYHLYRFNPSEKDFRTTVQKSTKNNAQLDVLLLISPGLEIIAKQIKEINPSTPLSSIETLSFSMDKALFNGSWFVTISFDSSKDFLEKLNKKIKTKTTEGSEYSYHGYKLLLKACEKADVVDGKINVKQVAKNLLSMKKHETSFGTWEVKEDGFITIPAIVAEIKDGKQVPVKE